MEVQERFLMAFILSFVVIKLSDFHHFSDVYMQNSGLDVVARIIYLIVAQP